jgi:hypothetical protein
MMLRKICLGLAVLVTVLMTGCCCERCCCRRPFLRRCCRPVECCAPTCCYPPLDEPCCSDPGPIISHAHSSPAPPVADALSAKQH